MNQLLGSRPLIEKQTFESVGCRSIELRLEDRLRQLAHHGVLGIHDLIPNDKVLAERYDTIEMLLATEAIRKHIAWVKKQK